jgi:hypothetical protein
MTLADHRDILQLVVLPVSICTLITSLPLTIWFLVRKRTDSAAKAHWPFILTFALLGAVSGICTGSSRTPVVGTVLPALLSFMTALCGYAFTKDSLKDMRPVLPFGLLALLLSAMYCAFVGSKLRFLNEVFATGVQKDMLKYERVELEIHKAEEFRKHGIPYRESTPTPLKSSQSEATPNP